LCRYVAVQAEFTRRFSARPKEARCLCPHEAVIPRNAALARRRSGARCIALPAHRCRHQGCRPCDVPITIDAQRALIACTQALVGPGEHLGRPGVTLKANTTHYYVLLAKAGITNNQLGVTAHGLRHEFGNEAYEQRAGTPSPVRGGAAAERTRDRDATTCASRRLGHNRPELAGCYLGSPRITAKAETPTAVPPEEDLS
jgi:hypothetical protein